MEDGGEARGWCVIVLDGEGGIPVVIVGGVVVCGEAEGL